VLHILLVVLYFFSIFLILIGIWAIISSILSKDTSAAMGAVIGVVLILIGSVLFAISDTPKWNDETKSYKNNVSLENNKNAPIVSVIK